MMDIQDAVDERITKIGAIINCLLATNDPVAAIDAKTIYNSLWKIRDYFFEINELRMKIIL